MKSRDVASTLRAVAGLRALCRSLPHLATPAERERLRRFEALSTAPDSVTEDDIEVLAVGWERWWRSGQLNRIVAMAATLPAGLVERDRRLASFLLAAKGG